MAAYVNGGWEFLSPRTGWRAWIEDEGAEAIFANGVWSVPAAPGASGGGLTVLEFDHAVAPGGAQATAGAIPAGALVHGVTARVTSALGGVAGWSLGVADAPGRYGRGLPTGLNAVAPGPLGAPLAYPEATPLLLTPEGGSFAGGTVRIAVHYLTLPAPEAA